MNQFDNIRERFPKEGKVIYSGRNTVKLMTIATEQGMQDVIVKRFSCRNIFQKIAYSFFSRSKAYKAYHNAIMLESLGFNTPKAFAYVEYRSHCLLKECYYISDIDHGTDLATLLPVHGNDVFSAPLADAFGKFVATLHSKGVIHHDLNSTNVRYTIDNDGGFSFSLIDINRMKFFPQGTTIPMNECLENLTRFTGRVDIVEYVARSYARYRGLNEESFAKQAVAVKIAHDKAWKRRKKITHPFRKN